MFGKLPVELRFSIEPGATIYMPGRIVPTVVRGYGHITLSFNSTERPELLSIGVRDIHWRFLPFAIPVDVDGDGRSECIEVSDVELDMGYLDGKASKGTLNLQTGDMEIVFEYMITAKQIPLLEKLGGRTVKFTVTDRGRMDLRKGSFEIHSGVVEIKEWPLTGALLRGGGSGYIEGPAPSTVDLNVVIQTPGAIGCGDVKQDHVTICPGDQIILCWSSSQDVRSVELDPGSVPLPARGVYPVMPPGPPDVVYRVTTVDASSVATDTVEINFYQEGQWLGPFQAEADGFRWTIEFPPTSISGRLEVDEVQLMPDGGCLNWRKFLLEHISPGGIVPDFGKAIENFDPVNLGIPVKAAGTWIFTAQLDPPNVTPYAKENEKPVCFRFRGKCS